MPRVIRRRDHGRSRRHKRHLREYDTALPMHPEDELAAHVPRTLGDPGRVIASTHDDTRSRRNRVLDALGALLMFLHLTRRHDTTHSNDSRVTWWSDGDEGM